MIRQCPLCRKPGTSPHHIIPRSEGGGDNPGNIIHLCQSCHDEVEEKWRDYVAFFHSILDRRKKKSARAYLKRNRNTRGSIKKSTLDIVNLVLEGDQVTNDIKGIFSKWGYEEKAIKGLSDNEIKVVFAKELLTKNLVLNEKLKSRKKAQEQKVRAYMKEFTNNES